MKYIASCSFGKDSLAMILTILAHGLPLDEVIYCEVMYDETTSGEYPEHVAFIYEKAIPILKLCYGLKITVLRDYTNYKACCYHIRTKGKRKGTPIGFPSRIANWCNGYLKMRPIRAYHKSQTDEIHEYVGIAVDEPKRLERLKKTPNTSAPLADYGITETEAMEICRRHYLLSPLYQTKARSGCWFCHNARISELRTLYWQYPTLWAELRKIQIFSENPFTNRASIFDFERRFEQEATQCTTSNPAQS